MSRLPQFLVATAALLAVSTSLQSAEPKSQLSYWAPGVINRAEGSVEMDVEFLHPRPALYSDWKFLFRTTGNGFSAGTSILSVTLCPPRDPRDLSATAASNGSAARINVATPQYELKRPYRVAFSWGKGQFSLWFDGKILGREALAGELSLLPEKFAAGQDSDSGFPSSFRIKALRVSDVARSGEVLRNPAPLAADEHATLLLGPEGSVISTRPTAWQSNGFAAAIFPVRAGAPLSTVEGQALALPLCMVNYTGAPKEFHLKIDVNDRSGASVATTDYTLTVPANSRYVPSGVSMPKISKTGYFQARMEVTDPAGKTQAYDLAFVVHPAEQLKPGKLAGYMGHHLVPFAKEGYSFMRAWAQDRVFLWCTVEPAKGDFQWEAPDRYLKTSKEEGFEVLGVLGYPPAWASTYSAAERDRLKISPKRTYSNSPDRYQPKNLDEWKAYVRAVVGRYHDRVKYWEIYNEVDFHPGAMHASFSGTTEDYLALLKSAYEIVKEIDPSCQVLTSGFSLTKGITDTRMPADLLKAGGAPYFDIFNVHGYTDKEVIAENVQLMRAAKPGVPLWQSEHMFFDGPNDDYLVATKCFWFLSQGFSKYFLHAGEFDRNFGELYPTPYFAVAAELGRQLRSCDEYAGPVEGKLNGVSSWKLKRSNGTFLQVFAAANGKARLSFENTPEVWATDLYGETLFRGKPVKPLEFSGMIYVVSDAELKVAGCERTYGNAIANPGFEMRDGDYLTDESLARPVYWNLRPAETPAKLMSFAPGHTGKYALKLKTPPTSGIIRVGQDVTLGAPGLWNYSASMKAPAGAKVFIKLQVNHGGQWIEAAYQQVTATGDWQIVSAQANLKAADMKGVALLGLSTENSDVEIDDVELIHLPDSPSTP